MKLYLFEVTTVVPYNGAVTHWVVSDQIGRAVEIVEKDLGRVRQAARSGRVNYIDDDALREYYELVTE